MPRPLRHICVIIVLVCGTVAPSIAAGQQTKPLNPAYLAGFPSVDTVKREIQGSNPVDTLARQVAALGQLASRVRRMQMAPGRTYGSFTPDEQHLIEAYTVAATQMSQAYEKTVSADAAKAFQTLSGRYELLDEAFTRQVFSLINSDTRTQFGTINRTVNDQAQARADQQRREAEQARTPAPPATNGGTPFVRNDPGTVAVRRCLELGGGDLECMAKGLTTGLKDMTGVNTIVAEPESLLRGLRMGGTYQTAAGIKLGFNAGNVNVASCGKLESDSHQYSLTRRGAQIQIDIQAEPTPLVVVLGPDGQITGPAAFDLKGRVIVGYRTYWVQQRRVSDNSIIPGSGHEEREPIYEPKMERCNFASLHATAPVLAQGSLVGQIVGIAGGGSSDPASDRSGTNEAPAGPRMAGTYASQGGLRIQFQPTAAEIDCGDAHTLVPYAVQNLPDRLLVTVRNANSPIALSLQPDGTLAGPATIDVAGRAVTGVGDRGATFAPRTARCAVGTLAAVAPR